MLPAGDGCGGWWWWVWCLKRESRGGAPVGQAGRTGRAGGKATYQVVCAGCLCRDRADRPVLAVDAVLGVARHADDFRGDDAGGSVVLLQQGAAVLEAFPQLPVLRLEHLDLAALALGGGAPLAELCFQVLHTALNVERLQLALQRLHRLVRRRDQRAEVAQRRLQPLPVLRQRLLPGPGARGAAADVARPRRQVHLAAEALQPLHHRREL